MSARRPLSVGLGGLALFLVACQNNLSPLTGIPRIAGQSGSASTTISRVTASGKPTKASPSPSVRPSATPTPSPSPSVGEPAPAPLPTPSSTLGSSGGTGASGGTSGSESSSGGQLALSLGSQLANSWLAGPALQHARAGLVAGTLDNRLIALEGEHRPSFETLAAPDDVWALVTAHDLAQSATAGPAVPNGRSRIGLGLESGTMLSVGGQNGSGAMTAVLRYGPTGLQSLVGDLATAVQAAASGVAGGRLIVAGGLTSDNQVTNAVQRMDLTTKAVSAGSPMPQAVAGAAYALLDGKLYVFGGYTLDVAGQAVPRADVQIYDPVQDSWRVSDGQAGSPLPLALPRHSAAAVVNGTQLIVAGGVTLGGALLDSVLRYDPVANTWQSLAAMPTPRALLALAIFQDRCWALGGVGAGGQVLTTVEVYRP